MQADKLNKKHQQVKQAASRDLPPECQAAQLEREKQAKITGLNTPTKSEERYPGWVVQARKKPVAGINTPTSYQTPGDLKQGMTTAEHDAALGVELGAEAVIDPLASLVSCSSPGPQIPPQFMDTEVDIPSITLPGASPVTHAENQLLDVNPDSPMLTTSATTSTASTPLFSRAPGSAMSSTRGTPMSGTSPAVGTPPLGLRWGICCFVHEKSLQPQTAFADIMRRNHLQEEPEEPIPQEGEEDPDWM